MTSCKIIAYSGNIPLDRIRHVLVIEGFTSTETVSGRHHISLELDILKDGVGLSSAQKTSIKSAAKDFGLHIKWL